MDKEKDNTVIIEKDISFIESEFSKANSSLSLSKLAQKLAYKKNASQLSQEVKKYDPSCKYEVNDLIYKEYNEPLLISSKCAEPFEGAVVLKVVNKITYENFNCEMLEVDCTGGGTFRKHIDYMKKTKTQVLLPSNTERKESTPEVLKKEDDPRLTELPMTDKDMRKLEKNLEAALSHSDKFFHWTDHWQLKEKQVNIQDKKIKQIEKSLSETKQSAFTTDLVATFFDQPSSSKLFDLHCLSLNYTLEKKYKKKFNFVSPDGWGKWILKDTVDSFMKDLPLSAPKAKVPLQEKKKEEKKKSPSFPFKVYLTWRDVLSGGLKIPKDLSKEFSHSREYILTDSEGKKDYPVYYYPSSHIFIGLKEFYEVNNVPQGASLTLEKKDLTHFNITLKKSKKKISVPQVTYDPKEDKFSESEKEMFTFSLPNKIIFLDKETLKKLFSLYPQRNNLDLRELLFLIFKNFGLEGETLSLHSLRAFHLIDVLKQTTQEEVEKTMLSSNEFGMSEKKKGLFFYQDMIKVEDIVGAEELVEMPKEISEGEDVEAPAEETLPEIGTVGEIAVPEELEEIEEVEEKEEVVKKIKVKAPPPLKKEVIEAEPRKEKETRKKKHKEMMEVERAPRRRKGEKRFIEERIELEESEQEALFAVKAKEKKEIEEVHEAAKKKEKKEEFKDFVTEEPKFGLFADKLKSALDKTTKKPDKKEKKKK